MPDLPRRAAGTTVARASASSTFRAADAPAGRPREACPSVCCVVLSWNEADLTLACLSSLAEQTWPALSVVVVDNGSIDASVARIRAAFPHADVVELETNAGYSEGNNVGIRRALAGSADYVLLLNNDTTLDPSMLAELVAVAEGDASIGIAGPRQFYHDEPRRLWGAANYVDWRRGAMRRHGMGEEVEAASDHRGATVVDADYIDTCAVLVRRAVFEGVGLMDPRYFLNFEDADLGVRARRAGFRVVHVPAARMWHKVSASMGLASPATTYYMTRNALLFFRTHGRGGARLGAVALIVLRTIRTIAAWSIKAEYRDEMHRRRRSANLYALRDFVLGRFGQMGSGAASACAGRAQ